VHTGTIQIMSDYNFENFNDYEFEILCRDLLNEDQRINVKSKNGLPGEIILSFSNFKRGKDGGIDLFYNDDENKVIGQVKLSSGKFLDLLGTLKRGNGALNELEKVKRHQPAKYIFMTSVPLSLSNKETLQEYFSPYIKAHTDIYGREDLNRLLAQFNHIERRHTKLYFNNPLVLERLQNYASISRSRFSIEEMIKDSGNFVQTASLPAALSILDEQKLLIIKGQPGVGKTTLPKWLSFY
jgi:hypothetical protein